MVGDAVPPRPGDVFLLGPHRVICGNARDPEIVRRLLRHDTPAQPLLTDEPYNAPIAGDISRGDHREFAMASGEMSEAQYLAFNLAWMHAFLPVLVDGAILATFIDWRSYPVVHAAATRSTLSTVAFVDEDALRSVRIGEGAGTTGNA